MRKWQSPLDENGQPINPDFNAQRVLDRSVDEFVGLCKGLVSDGIVNEKEAKFLYKWLRSNEPIRSVWPAKVLFPRIEHMFSDGCVDSEERKELFELLSLTIGNETAKYGNNFSSSLPCSGSIEDIEFEGCTFVLTGTFAYGPRKLCIEEIENCGGFVSDSVTKKTDYLVVGLSGSRDWIHSTHGRKIEKALEVNENGGMILIVHEESWSERIWQLSSLA